MFFFFSLAVVTFLAEIVFDESANAYRWNPNHLAAYELSNN